MRDSYSYVVSTFLVLASSRWMPFWSTANHRAFGQFESLTGLWFFQWLLIWWNRIVKISTSDEKKLFTFFLPGVYPVSQTFIFHGGQNIEQLQEKLEAIHPSTLAMFLRQHWSRATLMMLPPRIGRRWRYVVAAGISALRSSSLFDINKCKLNHTM